MTNFQSISKGPRFIDFQPCASFQFIVMFSSKMSGLFRFPWQLAKELAKAILIPAEIWRQLPQNRSELFAKSENAGGKKIGERYFGVPQLLHVSDETRTFHAENESSWRFRSPPNIARGQLEGVE